MKDLLVKTKPFDTRKSIRNASQKTALSNKWILNSDGEEFVWRNPLDRVLLIRKGIPYAAIETISNRLNRPVKALLNLFSLPQTTYNKKKAENAVLDTRNSELILLITELLDFGASVFNQENDKFQRWLKKPNLSLGGQTPLSLLDTTTGIEEVKFCLNRIEYGNFA
ncbi:DUF2384 domain-containing protein [Sphingobacteriaceae bacterium WQ 2009]|uniref:DUF2384 domain-containing protein n=1 Tax=Rhinopithecimicrobium faecis TaxID=2820698 RepID=A0A8T4H710_9SPHI|nr:DUF2384 domain-containing protein [Sphingobacteriaceae bacterium WQ 2009]